MINITLTGNIVKDPELKYSVTGTAYTLIRVAGDTGKNKDKVPNPPVFIDVKLWQKIAENVAISLTKGMRIVVTGELTDEVWEKDGKQISHLVIRAHEVCPSLRYSSVIVEPNPRDVAGNNGFDEVQ